MDEDQEANIETSQNENVQANSTNPNRSSMEEDSSSRGTSVDDSHSHSSRFRRLVSQSTFHENDLDNAVLNSQQQFIDLSDSSDSDDEDPDQLFEEYLRRTEEVVRSQARLFDDELPMNHSYLGATDVVRGTNCFEPGQVYEIPVCEHHSLVFPGEIFPMIMSNESIFARTPVSNEGITFGLIFADETDKYDRIYGVTCHVFEKGLDAHGHITVKSKADQRFVVVKDEDGLPSIRNHIFYAKVKILPEFELPEPINLSLSNYMMKFLHNSSQSAKLKVLLTSCNRWPQFVYDQYSIVTVNEKVERFLAMLSISAPSEPTLKSFWLARNVPLNQAERMKIFTSNCVNERMLLIGKSLTYMCFFDCKRCKSRIANYSDIFAMAKGNVNANYCNPAGYIHETLTLQKTLDDSLQLVERASTEFSWFPGYAWQIAVCANCESHIGWKFIAVSKNLKPKSFFGLSCKSLVVSPVTNNETMD